MSRTWLLRGVIAAVFVVMAGAWLTGVAVLGGDDSTATDKASVPVAPESSATPDEQPSVVLGRIGERRSPEATASDDATTPEAQDTDQVEGVVETDAPGDSDGQESAPRTPQPTRHAPSPSPSKPGKPGGPSSTPPPSSEPTEKCTDLVTVLGCVLAPITSRP